MVQGGCTELLRYWSLSPLWPLMVFSGLACEAMYGNVWQCVARWGIVVAMCGKSDGCRACLSVVSGLTVEVWVWSSDQDLAVAVLGRYLDTDWAGHPNLLTFLCTQNISIVVYKNIWIFIIASKNICIVWTQRYAQKIFTYACFKNIWASLSYLKRCVCSNRSWATTTSGQSVVSSAQTDY